MLKRFLILFCLSVSLLQITKGAEILKLNSDWKFRKVGDPNWHQATVPGSVYTDLLSNKMIPDPYLKDNADHLQWVDSAEWEYQSSFVISDELAKSQEMELVFSGLDTYADVFLNDVNILQADNMFRSWKVNCQKLIKPGANSLRIVFHPAIKKAAEASLKIVYTLPGEDRVFTRKAAYQYGWDFAPRLLGCGIWKPIELHFWNHLTFQDVRIQLKELTDKRATMRMEVDVLANDTGFFNLKMINKGNGQRLGKNEDLKKGLNTISYDYQIFGPKKWWCNGYGDPFLYTFYFEGNDFKGNIDRKEFSYGLRTIELVQEKDSIGKSFYFKLNGVPVFAKGSNVVPMDMFPGNIRTGAIDSLVDDAAECNMNMLRVWGGGIYPDDAFYKRCDEKGILVWQDFMFACSMLPGDSSFVSSVREEITDNVRRLRHHACIAVWCGNNEADEGWKNWGWQKQYKYSSADSIKIWSDYNKLFLDVIPSVLKLEDPARSYLPSSPSIGWGHKESLLEGDSHYWGIWWGMEPFSNYENKVGRFVSEYGFQGLPASSTIESFGEEANWKISDPVLKAHQKHPTGFETISEYMKRDYPETDNANKYRYYSQLLQSDGLRTAIEAHRRVKPKCMGTLFWQWNDSWPGISWSARDYFGNRKAAAYMVRDRFKNIIVSPVIEGGNLNTYIVSDSVNDLACILVLKLYSFDGKERWSHQEKLSLKAGSSTLAFSIDTSFTKQKIDPAKGYLLASVVSNGVTLDQRVFYFRKPKDLILSKANPEFSLDSSGTVLSINSKVLIKNLCLRANENDQFELNYFDILPGAESRVKIPAGIAGKEIKLQMESLNDKKGMNSVNIIRTK